MQYCRQETRDYVNGILESPGTHFILREWIEAGLKRDPVDTLKNATVLKDVFQRICDDLLGEVDRQVKSDVPF